MKRYRVHINEVHCSTREVEAESAEDAIKKCNEDLDTEISLEYSYTLDSHDDMYVESYCPDTNTWDEEKS